MTRWSGSRLVASTASALVAVVMVLLCAACGAGHRVVPSATGAGGPRVATFGGHFAGYLWQGASVSSINGDWRVPALLSRTRLGAASTWVGAQSPGDGNAPFIQVGTQEEVDASRRGRPPHRFFEAFWSDTHRDFHPYPLFPVAPGDEVSASMHLVGRTWTLTIADLTSSDGTTFSTREEGSGRFNEAQWIQEDPTDDHNHALHYPEVGPTRFSVLTVNSFAPRAGALQSFWMALPHGYLGPGGVEAGAFTVASRRLTSAGARYLRVVDPVDEAIQNFDDEEEDWSARTSHATITRATARLVATLRRGVRGLAPRQWPAAVSDPMGRVASIVASLIAQLPGLASVGVHDVGVELDTAFGSGYQSAIDTIRHRLGLPELDS